VSSCNSHHQSLARLDETIKDLQKYHTKTREDASKTIHSLEQSLELYQSRITNLEAANALLKRKLDEALREA
jgi:chromosome segregation ATPase